MRSTTNDLEISIRRGIFLGVSQVLHSLKDDDLLIKVTVSAIKKSDNRAPVKLDK